MSRSLALRLALICIGARILDPSAGAQPIDTGWVWTLPGSEFGTAGIAVSDFDGDGSDEIHLSSNGGPYYGTQYGYWHEWRPDGPVVRQQWSSLFHDNGIQKLLATRAPENRFLVVSGSELLVFFGIGHELERTIVTGYPSITDLVAEDLDDDGDLELALCDEQNLYVLSFATGLESARRYGFGCTQLLSGQLDGDPEKELVLVGNNAGGIILDGATLGTQWIDLGGFGPLAALADVDSDGYDEIIYYREDDQDLVAMTPGAPVPHWEIENCSPTYLEGMDVDDDGEVEVLAYDTDVLGGLAAIDAATGIPLWSLPLGVEPRAVAAGDFDGDDEGDLAVAGSNVYYGWGDGVFVFDTTTLLLQSRTPRLSSRLSTFAVGDLDGDSSPDLVAAFANDNYGSDGRLAYFDIADRRLDWIEPTTSVTDYLALGQADADSQPELCRTNSEYYNGQTLRCEDALTHVVEWDLDLQGGGNSGQVAFLDLDGSAPFEVVVPTGDGFVYAFEGPTGWLRWASTEIAYANATLRLAEVGGDAQPELLVGGAGNYYGGSFAIVDPATGAVLAGPHDMDLASFEAGQVDADPEIDVFGGIGTYSGSQLAEVDPWTGAIQPAIATFDDSVRAIRIAEMTGDAQLDFVVLSGPRAFVIDGSTAGIVWESPNLGSDAEGFRDLELVDLGGSDRPEILVNLGVGFAVFGVVELILFDDGFESADTSAWSSTLP